MMNHSKRLQAFKRGLTADLGGDFGHIHVDELGLRTWQEQVACLPELMADLRAWIADFPGFLVVVGIELEDAESIVTEFPSIVDALKATESPPEIRVIRKKVFPSFNTNTEEYMRVLPDDYLSAIGVSDWRSLYVAWRYSVGYDWFIRSIILYSE